MLIFATVEWSIGKPAAWASIIVLVVIGMPQSFRWSGFRIGIGEPAVHVSADNGQHSCDKRFGLLKSLARDSETVGEVWKVGMPSTNMTNHAQSFWCHIGAIWNWYFMSEGGRNNIGYVCNKGISKGVLTSHFVTKVRELRWRRDGRSDAEIG
jgi:hypothetical protein